MTYLIKTERWAIQTRACELGDHVNMSTMPGIDFTLQNAGIGTNIEDQFFLQFATVDQSKTTKETADLVVEGCVHGSMEFFNENARNFANNMSCFMIPWAQQNPGTLGTIGTSVMECSAARFWFTFIVVLNGSALGFFHHSSHDRWWATAIMACKPLCFI